MSTTLSKKEQLQLAALAASIEIVWVGEDHQHAQLPGARWKDWDPFEDDTDAFVLANVMGYTINVSKILGRTTVSNGVREIAMSHGRNGKNVARATRLAITRLAAYTGLAMQKESHGNK